MIERDGPRHAKALHDPERGTVGRHGHRDDRLQPDPLESVVDRRAAPPRSRSRAPKGAVKAPCDLDRRREGRLDLT